MKTIKVLLPLLTFLSSPVLSAPATPDSPLVTRDVCTTNTAQWTSNCVSGADQCCCTVGNCLPFNICRDDFDAQNWCQNNFSGQNCAHAYNQGARHYEKSTGESCGITPFKKI